MSFILNNSYNDSWKKEKEKKSINKEITGSNPFKKIYIKSKKYLNNNYGPKNNNLKYSYLGLIMEILIFNKYTHLVSVFKDYMIANYLDEFLKRYYKKKESLKKISNFSKFYKNYLKFFCSPTLRDLFSNELIHERFENKAQFFYNKNNKNNKKSISSEQNKGLYEDSETSENSDEEENNNKNNHIERTFFNENIRKKIEKYSPIHTSMELPKNGSILRKSKSYLLITKSNEKSLFNIVDELNKKNYPEIKNKKTTNNNLLLLNNKKNINNNVVNNKDKIRNNKNYKNNETDKNIYINSINFESSKSNRIIQNKKNIFSNKIKKYEAKNLKILLNNNAELLNSNSNKKFRKNNGLWKLLKLNQNINIESSKNGVVENKNNLNNIHNSLSIGNNIRRKNKPFSNLNYYNKQKNKLVIDINKNLIKSNTKYKSKESSINNKNIKLENNFSLNSNKNKENEKKFPKSNKNNEKIIKRVQLDSIVNKIQINAFNSIIKMATYSQKFILKIHNNNKTNLKQNTNSNHNLNLNLNYNKKELRTNSYKNKKLYHSPSNYLEFIKISKMKENNVENKIYKDISHKFHQRFHNDKLSFKNDIEKNNFHKFERKIISRNKRNSECNALLHNFGISYNNNRTSLINFKLNKGVTNKFTNNKLKTINHNSNIAINNINKSKNINLINHFLFSSFNNNKKV